MEILFIEIFLFFIGIFGGLILGFSICKFKLINTAREENNILELNVKVDNIDEFKKL